MRTVSKVTVSAPGKLLFAGGYLVLESPNVGVVIAVDKRFYCQAEVHKNDDDHDHNNNPIEIQVASPQFGETWKYDFDRSTKRLSSCDTNESKNVFVEKTLRVCLLALLDDHPARHPTISEIILVVQGDNDFYSLIPHLEERGESKTLEAALNLPKFLPAARIDGKIAKTGLGSSACLVTSMVASLYYALGHQSSSTTDKEHENEIIFRLAQVCHCHCQGKVGSGFDVAAACYGSHIYERFPKSLLADLLSILDNNKNDDDGSVSMDALQAKLRSIILPLSQHWAGGVRAPLNLPNFIQVMLADVSGGSESPSMARTVLSWKNNHGSVPAATGHPPVVVPHWDDLARINQQIGDLLQTLSSHEIQDSDLEALAQTFHVDDEWMKTGDGGKVGELLADLRAASQESRRHLKAMGQAAGVPIEPDEQTALIDETLKIPGVIAALVPGAGGYDAIACLYLNHPSVRHAIADFWCSWPKASVCPLTVQGARYGEGIRIESEES